MSRETLTKQRAIPLMMVPAHAASCLAICGGWLLRRSYWTIATLAVLCVFLKTGFKWAGTTGDGWYIEFQQLIDNWPLKESLADPGWALYQEDFSSILLFRLLHMLGLPMSSATWNLIHWVASIICVLLLIRWAKKTYGDSFGRIVLLLIIFGSTPIVLLQEIGRYDSIFFLGAILVVTVRRWWLVTIGIILLASSSWTMGMGLAASLFLCGLVITNGPLIRRGVGVLSGCVAAAIFMMLVRIFSGGDPGLGRLGVFGTGVSNNGINPFYQTWWNLVQPFPNWIWAAFGVTWILFALVIMQVRRRRLLLATAIIALPVLAGAINGSDGTREHAFTITATLLAVATQLEPRSQTVGEPRHIVVSPALLGGIAVVCLASPVIDVNPHVILNPWGWVGLYGLDYLYRLIG